MGQSWGNQTWKISFSQILSLKTKLGLVLAVFQFAIYRYFAGLVSASWGRTLISFWTRWVFMVKQFIVVGKDKMISLPRMGEILKKQTNNLGWGEVKLFSLPRSWKEYLFASSFFVCVCFLVADQLYTHPCVSVCVSLCPSPVLCVPKICINVRIAFVANLILNHQSLPIKFIQK